MRARPRFLFLYYLPTICSHFFDHGKGELHVKVKLKVVELVIVVVVIVFIIIVIIIIINLINIIIIIIVIIITIIVFITVSSITIAQVSVENTESVLKASHRLMN